MNTQTPVDVAVPAAAVLGEGPVWDATERRLLWVDIEGRMLHRYDPVSEGRPTPLRRAPVSVRWRRGRGAASSSPWSTRSPWPPPGADVPAVIATVEPSAPTRMNDGNCDSRGRFYAGTMALDERSPVGSLYRLDPDGAVEQILSGVTVSNGIDWSLDGETMFYVDSAAQSLDAFDFDVTAGRISNRRTVVRFSPDEGAPDGLTIDRRRVCVGGALGRMVDQALHRPGGAGTHRAAAGAEHHQRCVRRRVARRALRHLGTGGPHGL